MKKRQELICHGCEEQYSVQLPETGDHFLVVCPYCQIEAMVDLMPYPKHIESYQDGEGGALVSDLYDLPELIRTQEKSEKQDE